MGSGGGLFGGSTRHGSAYGCCSGCCLVSMIQGILALAAVVLIILGIISLIA